MRFISSAGITLPEQMKLSLDPFQARVAECPWIVRRSQAAFSLLRGMGRRQTAHTVTPMSAHLSSVFLMATRGAAMIPGHVFQHHRAEVPDTVIR